jgi:hypothetical protein
VRFAVAILPIDCVERDVAVRLKVIASRIDQPPSAGDPLATHAGIREGLRLKTRATRLAPVGERRVTVDFVVHAHRFVLESPVLILKQNRLPVKRKKWGPFAQLGPMSLLIRGNTLFRAHR